MAIYQNEARELLRKFSAAQEVEAVTIKKLHDAVQGRMQDSTLMILSDSMTKAHNKKMAIWDELQSKSGQFF